jgi:hypothetical protein
MILLFNCFDNSSSVTLGVNHSSFIKHACDTQDKYKIQTMQDFSLLPYLLLYI